MKKDELRNSMIDSNSDHDIVEDLRVFGSVKSVTNELNKLVQPPEYPIEIPTPSEALQTIPIDILEPETYSKRVENKTIHICIHKIISESFRGHSHIYLRNGEAVFFTTNVDSFGYPAIKNIEFQPPDKLEVIDIEIRRQSHLENDIGTTEDIVDFFQGKIELRRFRAGVIEKSRISIRSLS